MFYKQFLNLYCRIIPSALKRLPVGQDAILSYQPEADLRQTVAQKTKI